MSTPGTEMILPSLPFADPGPRLLSAVWLIISLAIIILISNDPIYQISEIRFEGIERVNSGDVAIYTGLQGQKAFQVNPKVIETSLQRAFPELVDVSVRVGMPSSVMITASERQPVIQWQAYNKIVWIDREGVIFPRRGEVDEASLLVVVSDMAPPAPPPELLNDIEDIRLEVEKWQNGADATPAPVGPDRTDPALVEAALKLAEYIPPGTVLVYSHYDGLGWSDSRGWNVFVGLDLDEIEFKMVEYQAIVDHLEKKGIRPRMISVEHVHAPFYRLE